MIGTLKRKKILLFLSNASPLWARLFELERHLPAGDRGALGRQKVPGPREHHLGVSHETIRKWRLDVDGDVGVKDEEGIQNSLRHLTGVLEQMPAKLRNADLQGRAGDLRDVVTEYAVLLADDAASLYRCGQCLGMDRRQTQLAIDTIVHSASPLLIRAYYQSKTVANDDFNGIGGLYHVWMRRMSRKGQKYWVQCPVQVRYLVPVGEQFVIRAKLLVPDLQADDSSMQGAHFHYDGFVRIMAPKIYWVFEKREAHKRDMLFFVSDHSAENIEGGATIRAHYLTSGQDSLQSTVGDRAIFHRIQKVPRTAEEYEQQIAQMRSMPRLLAPEVPTYQLFQRICQHIEAEQAAPSGFGDL